MKLFRMAIWTILFVTATAGFAENLGRPSARERALHVRPPSVFSTPGHSASSALLGS